MGECLLPFGSDEVGGACGTHGGRNVCRVLVGKPEGKRLLGSSRRRWENEVKIDVRDIVWGVWSGFAWLRIGTVGGLL
jgi:hypothetical protein